MRPPHSTFQPSQPPLSSRVPRSVRIRPLCRAHPVGQPSSPGWSTKPQPRHTSVPLYCVCSFAGPAFASPTVRRHAVTQTITAPTVDRSSELIESKSSLLPTWRAFRPPLPPRVSNISDKKSWSQRGEAFVVTLS